MNRYLVAMGILIAGILAIVSITPMVFPSQPQVVTTTTESPQSLFYTTITTAGGITMTEVLENTTLQIADPSRSSTLDFAPLGQFAFLLLTVAIVLGFWFYQRD